MINFDGREVAEEFNRVFDNLAICNKETNELENFTINTLTKDQLWFLTKLAKHVRGRCRNNIAFNNYMNRNFAPAKFQEVPKEYNGKSYKGLRITVKDGTFSDGGEE